MSCNRPVPNSCRGYHTLRQYYNPPQHPYRWYNIRGRDPPVQLIEFIANCPCGCQQWCRCGENCPCCKRQMNCALHNNNCPMRGNR
jgi:hypothetical protein